MWLSGKFAVALKRLMENTLNLPPMCCEAALLFTALFTRAISLWLCKVLWRLNPTIW